MTRESLGEFEHQVMATLLRLGGDSYSVPITLDLEKRTGRSVAQPAVYIALRRLEKKALLRSRFETGASAENRASARTGSGAETGHRRRYFRPTRRGLRALRESRRALELVWEDLDTSLLDEV